MKLTVKRVYTQTVGVDSIKPGSYFMRIGVGDCLYRKVDDHKDFTDAIGISSLDGLERIQIRKSETVFPTNLQSAIIEVS